MQMSILAFTVINIAVYINSDCFGIQCCTEQTRHCMVSKRIVMDQGCRFIPKVNLNLVQNVSWVFRSVECH